MATWLPKCPKRYLCFALTHFRNRLVQVYSSWVDRSSLLLIFSQVPATYASSSCSSISFVTRQTHLPIELNLNGFLVHSVTCTRPQFSFTNHFLSRRVSRLFIKKSSVYFWKRNFFHRILILESIEVYRFTPKTPLSMTIFIRYPSHTWATEIEAYFKSRQKNNKWQTYSIRGSI